MFINFSKDWCIRLRHYSLNWIVNWATFYFILFYFLLLRKVNWAIWFRFLITLINTRVQLSLIVKILKNLIFFRLFLWLFHFKEGKSTLACHLCIGLVFLFFTFLCLHCTVYINLHYRHNYINLHYRHTESDKYYKFCKKCTIFTTFCVYHVNLHNTIQWKHRIFFCFLSLS